SQRGHMLVGPKRLRVLRHLEDEKPVVRKQFRALGREIEVLPFVARPSLLEPDGVVSGIGLSFRRGFSRAVPGLTTRRGTVPGTPAARRLDGFVGTSRR